MEEGGKIGGKEGGKERRKAEGNRIMKGDVTKGVTGWIIGVKELWGR